MENSKMTELQQKFIKYSTLIKTTLTKRPTDDELLKLYALFKQANFGDNTTKKPNFLDIKENAKWNRWKSLHGKSKIYSMKKYIKLVKILQEKYS